MRRGDQDNHQHAGYHTSLMIFGFMLVAALISSLSN